MVPCRRSDSPLVRKPIGPTAHWSENPLVRWPIGPKTHWSEDPLVRKGYHLSENPLVRKGYHWSENPLVRKSVIGPKIAEKYYHALPKPDTFIGEKLALHWQ